METVTCPLCGRRFALPSGSAGACPSCGVAMPTAPGGGGQDATTQAASLATTAAVSRTGADSPGHAPDPPTATLPPQPLPAAGEETTATLPSARPAGEPASDDSATQPVTPPVTAALPAALVAATNSSTNSSSNVAGSTTSGGSGLRVVGIVAIVIVLLAILTLAVLAATGVFTFGPSTLSATPRPTAVPSPTVPAGFTTYVTPGYFTIAYPTQWNPLAITPQGTSTTGAQGATIEEFLDPSGTTLLVVLVNPEPQPVSAVAVDSTVLRFFSGGKPVEHLQGPIAVTIAGVRWDQEAADLAISHISGQSHAVVATTTHGQFTYTIFYAAPANSFTTDSVADFQQMLSSFAFAS